MSKRTPLLAPVALFAVVCAAAMSAQESDAPLVVRARLADVIHPITAEYVVQSISDAEQRGADLFVLEIDTPGGLDTSMREIIQAFLASDVPVCLYVGPSGARAASAGFFMAMAADIVAMAPSTNMGAASPVAVGGELDETMENKLQEDAQAYIRSLSEQRGRPVDLAVAAVSEGRSYSAAEAVDAGLADLQVGSFADLLVALEGRRVARDDRVWQLALGDAVVVNREMSTRQRLLAIIAHPQIAYILMLIGVAGLYFELSTPGAVLPGVVGGLSLVLAMLAFQVLPISFAGLALIALAILFFILEIKVTSYGLLTVAGLVSFVLGSLMLVPGPIPEMRLQAMFVVPTALAVAGLAAFLLSLVLRTHRGQVLTGPAGLVGDAGRATRGFVPGEDGEVFVHGEVWKARSDQAVQSGDAIEVTGLESGMIVRVRPGAGNQPNQG